MARAALALAALALFAAAAHAAPNAMCAPIPGCELCDLVQRGPEDSGRTKLSCYSCVEGPYVLKGKKCREWLGRAAGCGAACCAALWHTASCNSRSAAACSERRKQPAPRAAHPHST